MDEHLRAHLLDDRLGARPGGIRNGRLPVDGPHLAAVALGRQGSPPGDGIAVVGTRPRRRGGGEHGVCRIHGGIDLEAARVARIREH